MKVEIHRLFELLLETVEHDPPPEAALGFSLAAPPRLGAFLDALDPDTSLDWSTTSFQGWTPLRERVIERTDPHGPCTPDDVLITAGAAEANFLAVTQLVQPGDGLVVERPGWPQAEVLGRAVGAELRVVERRDEDGWALDPDALEAAVTARTRLIFLCNPHNPTGRVLTERELRRVASVAARVGAYLLVDEVYAGLEWTAPRAPPVAALYERGVTTGSVSKTLGLQGIRTGWLVCRDPALVRSAMILRENTSEIMNVLGERIAEIALRPRRFEAAIATARSDGRANLAVLQRFVEARPELSWRPPDAGLIGLARLHLEPDADELARRLLAPPYRTFVIPGSAYGRPQHLRLGVGGGPEAGLELGLERLAALLDALA